jgi:hypothetical protein
MKVIILLLRLDVSNFLFKALNIEYTNIIDNSVYIEKLFCENECKIQLTLTGAYYQAIQFHNSPEHSVR